VTQRDGARVSTAHAYLHPHAARSNLHVMTSSHVTRVLFDANKGTYYRSLQLCRRSCVW
jgi:choline dehydrogenase